jgi:hypothetical protein
MIEDNYFQYLSNIHCPIEGALDSVPFCHFFIEGRVPKKCTLCPYLFEGECLWQRDKKPSESFSLKITQSRRSGKDALNKAFQKVMGDFSLLPHSVCILLVIEGDLAHNTISELQEIHEILQLVNLFHRGHQEREFYFGVYLNPSLEGEVRVSIVQELQGVMGRN